LIPSKTEGLGYLPPFRLLNTEGLGVLSFLILLKTQARCHGVDGCYVSNTDDFELDIASSPLSFSASFTVLYY